MNSLEIFKNVEFNEELHKYFLDGKEAGISTTGFIHCFSQEFNEKEMAQKIAKKTNCTVEEVLKMWKFKRDYSCAKGNEIHLFAQSLWKNEKYETDYKNIDAEFVEQLKKDLAILQKQALEFYNDYKDKLEFVKDEQYLYDKDYDIAGAIDLLFKDKENEKLIICDFKSNKEIKYKGYNKMKTPLNILEDCNFIHYSLQVYIYKHILEKNTDLEMLEPFIVHFDITKENYTIITPKNMKEESKMLLEMRRIKMGKCIPILVIGKSGSGKSASLRNFKKEDYSLVNVLSKRLPFKNDISGLSSSNYELIKKFISETPKNIIVIDDSNYLMTMEMMSKAKETGYGKFTDIAINYWKLIEFIKNLDGDKRVYLMSHEEIDDYGNIKVRTVGKMLENQCCIEGMYTIVLRAENENNNFVFRTKTAGNDIVKTPMEMFETNLIENDLKEVDKVICEYYDINNEKEEVK
ncbi:MAG: hypothetical protein RR662_07175 [Clostridia bacterium]